MFGLGSIAAHPQSRYSAGARHPAWDAPTGSKVPVLLMVGSLDVITSPALARKIAAPFPNAKVVEVAHGTHLLVGQPGEDECVLRIEADFLKQGSGDGLDTACAATLPRGPMK